ncbi:uncharacterized protein LOC119589851 [Penaeus monodon]|uniref:uncharacterized protein LOC119589851 n=1 Tax=Penaeus monodon TaxID=6687 RepID=UPI0018A6FC4B|nr:uncharacterized protein LOC119589851 [Penaeus monodon]
MRANKTPARIPTQTGTGPLQRQTPNTSLTCCRPKTKSEMRFLLTMLVALCVLLLVAEATSPLDTVMDAMSKVLGVGEEEPCCTNVCDSSCSCCVASHPLADHKNEGVVLTKDPEDNPV